MATRSDPPPPPAPSDAPGGEEAAVLWRPGAAATSSALARFIERTERSGPTPSGDPGDRAAALYERSVADPDLFWGDVLDFCGVVFDGDPTTVRTPAARPRETGWFPGVRLNYAENLFARAGPGVAVTALTETGPPRTITWDSLRSDVAASAAWLRGHGVGPGDRVASLLPNRPEAVVSMLAAASLGAVWTSCSPDFGADAVLDRFGQVSPSVLLVGDGYFYKKRWFPTGEKGARLVAGLPSLHTTVAVPFEGAYRGNPPEGSVPYAETIARPSPPLYTRLPFDHPLFIVYSSGTTGPPKCIVHRAGGVLLEHLKEHVLHTDLTPSDVIFYQTTCGWMMWNWLVGALATGAGVVLFDGNPLEEGGRLLLDAVRSAGATVFGTNPRWLAAARAAGLETPGGVAPIKTILSTGSPLTPALFDYVYEKLDPSVRLSSVSGGTDLLGCFALGSPLLPVRRGRIQTRSLGLAVDVFGDDGRPLRDAPGELVCTAPFPSCPLGLYGDPDGSRFEETYYSRFPGVWRHGDYATIHADGSVTIHGRSDVTLNPKGVRIGTADIYRSVEGLPEVAECLAAGRETAEGEEVILFVRVRDGVTFDDPLAGRIRAAIRTGASPFHVPAVVAPVPDLPRTPNGKLVEVAVKDVLNGRPARNLTSIVNPESLSHIEAFARAAGVTAPFPSRPE